MPVNYLAVLVSALAMMVVGWAWYSPMMFAKPWMALQNMTPDKEQGKKDMPKFMVLMFIGTLVTSSVMAHVVYAFGSDGVWGGVQAGIWMWLGFVAPVMMGNYMFGRRPAKLYAIDVFHTLVALVISGVILTVWM